MADDDDTDGRPAVEEIQPMAEDKPNYSTQNYSFDRWVLVHFFTIFSFSFLLGIIIIHSSLLWHRYQSVSNSQDNNEFVSSLLDEYYGKEYGKHTQTFELKVNTSVFMS
ncbi:uncharacterized protein LOC106158942 [Lingula anatina]|uniref:Uncharacterized protein LOC106150489 n=1 Tax=Lingula anatina TaxID=7574 RepID=A0A1S3GYG3_LINAN|nr:uncharacterized protein LOC106150489 [Lingula anatina]XP_013390525.1 uncharacterized protein LOC106158942 [Lingula anatina]|eukprot:XP_013378798.1 uncharacterized protein LOC106150489 [Lingula anatina]